MIKKPNSRYKISSIKKKKRLSTSSCSWIKKYEKINIHFYTYYSDNTISVFPKKHNTKQTKKKWKKKKRYFSKIAYNTDVALRWEDERISVHTLVGRSFLQVVQQVYWGGVEDRLSKAVQVEGLEDIDAAEGKQVRYSVCLWYFRTIRVIGKRILMW